MFLEIPELADLDTIRIKRSELLIWKTTRGTEGTTFIVSSTDIEINNQVELRSRLTRLLESLPNGLIARFYQSTNQTSLYESTSVRTEAIRHIGRTQHRLLVSIETIHCENSFPFSKKKASKIRDYIRTFDWSSLGPSVSPASRIEIEEHFQYSREKWEVSRSAIESDQWYLGIIRLWKQGIEDIDTFSLPIVRELLPDPFNIVVTIEPCDPSKIQMKLRSQHNVRRSQDDKTSSTIADGIEDIKERIVLKGEKVFRVDFNIIVKRSSTSELKDDLNKCKSTLSQLGEVCLERLGLASTFRCTLPGGGIHERASFLEVLSNLTYYLPTSIRGTSEPVISKKSALPLHRSDGTVEEFDLFDDRSEGYNALITGSTGKGKSVLTNLLTASILNDPEARVIKVDVGGSYRKECELNNGVLHEVDQSSPSGINPLACLRTSDHSDEACSILTNLISGLLVEDGDTFGLPRKLRSEVEEVMLKYSHERPRQPSVDDLYKRHLNSIPRAYLLKRWTSEGVYKHALVENSSVLDPRYRYYNFQSLTNASDKDLCNALFGAVVTQFQVDSLINSMRKFCLIVDETPFFFGANCGPYLAQMVTNNRKYGQSCVLVAQDPSTLLLPANGNRGPDSRIIQSCQSRFTFSLPGDIEYFKKLYGFDDSDVDAIESLDRNPPSYSQVYLSDRRGKRVLTVAPTPQEYWNATSSDNDHIKLENLRNAVPGLSLKEAIECLSLARP